MVVIKYRFLHVIVFNLSNTAILILRFNLLIYQQYFYDFQIFQIIFSPKLKNKIITEFYKYTEY